MAETRCVHCGAEDGEPHSDLCRKVFGQNHPLAATCGVCGSRYLPHEERHFPGCSVREASLKRAEAVPTSAEIKAAVDASGDLHQTFGPSHEADRKSVERNEIDRLRKNAWWPTGADVSETIENPWLKAERLERTVADQLRAIAEFKEASGHWYKEACKLGEEKKIFADMSRHMEMEIEKLTKEADKYKAECERRGNEMAGLFEKINAVEKTAASQHDDCLSLQEEKDSFRNRAEKAERDRGDQNRTIRELRERIEAKDKAIESFKGLPEINDKLNAELEFFKKSYAEALETIKNLRGELEAANKYVAEVVFEIRRLNDEKREAAKKLEESNKNLHEKFLFASAEASALRKQVERAARAPSERSEDSPKN